MTENEISYLVRGAIFKVYNNLDQDYLNPSTRAHCFMN
jgi:hypothetical protein